MIIPRCRALTENSIPLSPFGYEGGNKIGRGVSPFVPEGGEGDEKISFIPRWAKPYEAFLRPAGSGRDFMMHFQAGMPGRGFFSAGGILRTKNLRGMRTYLLGL